VDLEHVANATPAVPSTADEADHGAKYPAHRLGVDDDVIPLPSLARSSAAANMTCPRGLVPVPDVVLPRAVTHPPSRRVPRVVHVTSRSRCVTPAVREHVEQWRRTANHSFFFHDDAAVRRLLGQAWVDVAFRTGRGENETSPGARRRRRRVSGEKRRLRVGRDAAGSKPTCRVAVSAATMSAATASKATASEATNSAPRRLLLRRHACRCKQGAHKEHCHGE